MDEMQEMLEHYRSTKLINEYCHGCDRLDGVRMASVYAKTSWDDHGVFKMPGQAFSQEVMRNRIARVDVMSHLLGQTLVDIKAEHAGAETYFVASVSTPDEDGTLVLHQLGGRYVDDLTREEGRWKITKRLTVRDWSITHTIEKDYMGTLQFIEGQTNGTDPSFAALDVVHSNNPDLAG